METFDTHRMKVIHKTSTQQAEGALVYGRCQLRDFAGFWIRITGAQGSVITKCQGERCPGQHNHMHGNPTARSSTGAQHCEVTAERQWLTGKVWIICFRPACLSAAHISASEKALPKGSRLPRTVPEKMMGSCISHITLTGSQHTDILLDVIMVIYVAECATCKRKSHSMGQTSARLRDERNARAQIKQWHGGNVDAVDENAAARRLHNALERHHERALAAACATRNSHLLPPCVVQQPLQNGMFYQAFRSFRQQTADGHAVELANNQRRALQMQAIQRCCITIQTSLALKCISQCSRATAAIGAAQHL